MRSETAKRILSETPQEVRDSVREYADETHNHRTKYLWACEELNKVKKELSQLKTQYREQMLLVRDMRNKQKRIRLNKDFFPSKQFEEMEQVENEVDKELEKFTAKDVEELPFKD